ncbi:mitochondrial carrier domain-containing protein [Polychytrium aggregatum]|uniref:mitochondrial carrier domain-containing protein n=1 Tax=Polychytrium aggregatum TaxID=110093 RepID=UPI0022FF06D7|nr:mitochondrial carrier domain-containing protein [Polychytrium aggregatum]KAI9206744.1 mitochondrial carrier domain-containing protein [Polychytrium aggregatum]
MSNTAEKEPPKMDQVKSFIAGGMAGVFSVLAGHPFDTLKVRLQTSTQYKGLADCFKQTIVKEGPLGLYKGMMSPLVGVTPMFALSFWAYEVGQQLVYAATPNRKSKDLTLTEFAIAGAFSAIPTTIVTTPMERIKVIMQTQDANPNGTKYKGMVDAGVGVFREGGLKGLYRGTIATLARDIPGSAAYFVAYEAVYRALKPKNNEAMSMGAVMFAGGMAGVAMWSIAIPPDVIKSRIQAAPPGTYKGFMDCATKMIATEGPSSLFKGLGPALLRAFPANAAGFLGRAFAIDILHRLW